MHIATQLKASDKYFLLHTLYLSMMINMMYQLAWPWGAQLNIISECVCEVFLDEISI